MSDNAQFVAWFRETSPYINAHRGRTFVIEVDGETVADAEVIDLVHDIALLNSLGIRLVLVHGARPQIEERLQARGLSPALVDGLRVTDAQTMASVKDATGTVRMQLEALLSQGVTNSPMAGARIRVVSGNFVMARPLGVHNGTDYQYTGVVRRVDTASINAQLELGAIVLVSPVGYSPTGEMFNLDAGDLAMHIASALGAAKLIYFGEDPVLTDAGGDAVRELTLAQLQADMAARRAAGKAVDRLHQLAGQACRQGVQRVHLLDRRVESALLQELFTRDGAGLMISLSAFDSMRPAGIDDAAGIIELIRPLEDEGILVRRSREKLEMEIQRFTVAERDGLIVGCAALLPVAEGEAAELACLAVHPEYRRSGYGESLLELLEADARRLGARRLFVLTTQAEHWFAERGFRPGTIDDLPVSRKSLYNYQRNSKVLIKTV